MKKHGYNLTSERRPEYKAWDHMKQRCLNPNNENYFRYGGRGITVCDRWLEFTNFIADMGDKPNAELTLERIDNSLGYCPENCRWATPKEQARNFRRNRYVEVDGERMILTDACEKFGLTIGCAKWRLDNGWSDTDTFKTKDLPKRGIQVTDGVNTFYSYSEAARFHNITVGAVINRCKSKSIKQANWQLITPP